MGRLSCHQSEHCGSGCWHFWVPRAIRSVLPLLSNSSTTENNEAAFQQKVLESCQYCKGTNCNSQANTRKKKKCPQRAACPTPPQRSTPCQSDGQAQGCRAKQPPHSSNTSPHGAGTCSCFPPCQNQYISWWPTPGKPPEKAGKILPKWLGLTVILSYCLHTFHTRKV